MVVLQGTERPRARCGRISSPPLGRVERSRLLTPLGLRTLPFEQFASGLGCLCDIDVGEVRIGVGEGEGEEIGVCGRRRLDEAGERRLEGFVVADQHVIVQGIDDRAFEVDHHLHGTEAV